MSNEFQVKLKNYLTPDSIHTHSLDVACNVPMDELFNVEGFILPPDYGYSKYPVKDYMKILLLNITKGDNTLRKTWFRLKQNPDIQKKLQIEKLPDYTSLTYFVNYRLGHEQFKEIKNKVNDYIHDNHLLITDNREYYRQKTNVVTINYAKIKDISRFVKKLVIEMVKDNKIVNQSYSDRAIVQMVFEALSEDCTSMFDYSTDKRDDYLEKHRGDFATSNTIFSRIRSMFDSDNSFDGFLYKVTQRVITVIRKYNSDLFNRKKFTVAFDTVGIATWESLSKSKDSESILLDENAKQKGTNKFRKYDVLSIVVDNYKFVIGFLPLKDKDRHNKERNIEALLIRAKSLIQVKDIVFDREFDTENVFAMLDKMHMEYVTPATRRENVIKIAKTMNDDILITDRTFYGRIVGKLVIFRKSIGLLENEYLYYSTNKYVTKDNALQLQEIYKTRWNIETTFSDLKVFKMNTTSRDTFIRTFLFGLATILYNLWVLANLITLLLYMKSKPKSPPITKKRFKRGLKRIIDTS